MNIQAIRTRPLVPPQDDLLDVLAAALPHLEERTILAITSKVISIWQGDCILATAVKDRDELIRQEADWYLPRDRTLPGRSCFHTVKNNLFVPSAGVDESNANGYYIRWPVDPGMVAKRLWDWCTKRYGLQDLGILITDSHSIPLRRGVVGISLAHYGFEPLHDYRGSEDVFGRQLKITQANYADGLAGAAVLVMGEGSECTPVAQITDIPSIRFATDLVATTRPYSSFEVPKEEDLYFPLIAGLPWERGGGMQK